jgi:hypothetical protein
MTISKEDQLSCIKQIQQTKSGEANVHLYKIIDMWVLENSNQYYCGKNIFEAFYDSCDVNSFFHYIIHAIFQKNKYPIENELITLKNGMSVVDFLISKNFNNTMDVYKMFLSLENKLAKKNNITIREITVQYKYFRYYLPTIHFMICNNYPYNLIFERILHNITNINFENNDSQLLRKILLSFDKKYINKRYSFPCIKHDSIDLISVSKLVYDTPSTLFDRYENDPRINTTYRTLLIACGFKTNLMLINELKTNEMTRNALILNNWDPLAYSISQEIFDLQQSQQEIYDNMIYEYEKTTNILFTKFKKKREELAKIESERNFNQKELNCYLKMKTMYTQHIKYTSDIINLEFARSNLANLEAIARKQLYDMEIANRYEKELMFKTHENTLKITTSSHFPSLFNKFIQMFGGNNSSEQDLEKTMIQLKSEIIKSLSTVGDSDKKSMVSLSKIDSYGSDISSCDTTDEISNSKDFRKIDSDDSD